VICNSELVEAHVGSDRKRQLSCGSVLLAIYVLTGQECLESDPLVGSGQI